MMGSPVQSTLGRHYKIYKACIYSYFAGVTPEGPSPLTQTREMISSNMTSSRQSRHNGAIEVIQLHELSSNPWKMHSALTVLNTTACEMDKWNGLCRRNLQLVLTSECAREVGSLYHLNKTCFDINITGLEVGTDWSRELLQTQQT